MEGTIKLKQKAYPQFEDQFVKIIDYQKDQAELKKTQSEHHTRLTTLETSVEKQTTQYEDLKNTIEKNNTKYIKEFHEVKTLILNITSKNELNHTALEPKQNATKKREKIHERIDALDARVKNRSTFYTVVASAIIVAAISIVLKNFNII